MRVQITFRTRAVAIACAVLAVVATPALLFAHAHLVRSTPAANSRLDAAPTALTLTVSEQPELKFTRLELLDSAGTSVPLGAVRRAPGNSMGVTAPITPTLTNGKYTVVWHTAAADGHATDGRYSFVVAAAAVGPATGAAASAPIITVTPTPGRRARTNQIVAPAQPIGFPTALRWAELVAVLTLVGAIMFRFFIVTGAELPAGIVADGGDRARRLAQAALLLFLVATLTRVVAQSDLITGASTARMSAIMTVVRETRWGSGWAVGFTGGVLALIGLVVARGRPPAGSWRASASHS